jgi:hypothetical protein
MIACVSRELGVFPLPMGEGADRVCRPNIPNIIRTSLS